MGDHRLPNGVRRLEEEHTQCGLMAKLEEDGSGCRRCVQVGVMVSPLKSLDQGCPTRFVQGPDCVPADAVGAGPPYI